MRFSNIRILLFKEEQFATESVTALIASAHNFLVLPNFRYNIILNIKLVLESITHI